MILKKPEDLLRKEYKRLVGNREIIVIGTGSLFRKIQHILNIDIENDVHCFVESSPAQKTFQGKQLISTEKLNSRVTKNEKVFVLVCSSAWSEIKESIGQELLQCLDWFAPYDSRRWIFMKDYLPIVKLEGNIRNLLLNYEEDIPKTLEESIAIMVNERAGHPHPYHAITLGVLLRLKGFHVRFLFNDLSNFGELNRGIGFNDFQNQILEDLLVEVAVKYDITYEKMSEQNAIDLTESELEKVQQFAYYNKIWHSKKVMFDPEDKELNEREASWLSNAKLIKGFLDKYQFDKVYAGTGVHSEWAALRILAEEKKSKVYSSEYARQGYSFSTSGPTVFQKDSSLFQQHQFSDKQIEIFSDLTSNHIKEKFLKDDQYKWNEPNVIIPLNIFWDSAAFNTSDIFIYFDQWLIKTILFLIEECNIHVYVRQHPHERNHGTGTDIKKLLKDKFGRSELFHFIDASSDIDTYSLVKSSQLVLPNTSTVGVEAAMIGKQVVVKNEVYYSDLGFVKKASSEIEYYNLIKESLSNPERLSSEQMNDAKFYFATTMLNRTDTYFGHWYADVQKWSQENLSTISEKESVQWMLDMIKNDRTLLENQFNLCNKESN